MRPAANAVIVPTGQGGEVNFFTSIGAHLVVDVTGYFTPVGGTTDGRFNATPTPVRLMDTRTGQGGKAGPFLGGQQFDLQVTGQGGVPAGATAVALTVTYVDDPLPGFLTVWPSGQPRPLASTTNPNGGGDIRSNLALVPLGTGGKVSIYSNAESHVVVDGGRLVLRGQRHARAVHRGDPEPGGGLSPAGRSVPAHRRQR